MKRPPTSVFFALIVGMTLLPCITAASFADERADWWRIDATVSEQLQSRERDLIAWANELAKEKPGTVAEALVKIDVMLRAALDQAAITSIRELKKIEPNVASPLLSHIYYAACDHFEAWDVAQALVETFAGRVSDVAIGNRLLKHFEVSGWSVDEIDAWLAKQVESARAETEPESHEGVSRHVFRPDPPKFWQQVRLRYLSQHDKARLQELLQMMEHTARENPSNAEKAIGYLEALEETPSGSRVLPELSWVGTSCEFEKATEWAAVAELLQRLRQWSVAARCFQQAMQVPLTDEETRRMSMMRQRAFSDEKLRAHFGIGLREGRARCLLEAGEAAAAQNLIEENAALRKKYGIGAHPFLAGRVQSESGARNIEEDILEKEELARSDPEYWLDRAEYYRGRREPQKEEDAYQEGLKRCEPLPRPQGKQPATHRARMLSDYARFLMRHDRHQQAVELLLAELERAPAESQSSQWAARLLGFDLWKYLDPSEPAVWSWLQERETWDNTEERLLWRMLERTPAQRRETAFERAEAMAYEQHPSRAATLGWILNRMGKPRRSLPLLEYAVEHADDEELRQSAAFTLFESYLDLGDWRAAEHLFSDASRRLSTSEDAEWLGRIALLAARDGATDDAMRIFRRVANMNLRTPLAERLAKLGLRHRVAEYYANAAARLPQSRPMEQFRKRLREQGE